MDMKKLLSIVSGTQQLNESINECGEMPPAAPQTNPMSMSVNVNAQGIDQIKDLMGLFRNEDAGQVPNVAGEITKIAPLPAEPDDSSDMIMKLAGVRKESVTGEFDKATTAPDEVEYDVDSLVHDGNDLNRSKGTYDKAQDGDNAMAVHATKKKMEEGIRNRLRELYQEIKESKR